MFSPHTVLTWPVFLFQLLGSMVLHSLCGAINSHRVWAYMICCGHGIVLINSDCLLFCFVACDLTPQPHWKCVLLRGLYRKMTCNDHSRLMTTKKGLLRYLFPWSTCRGKRYVSHCSLCSLLNNGKMVCGFMAICKQNCIQCQINSGVGSECESCHTCLYILVCSCCLWFYCILEPRYAKLPLRKTAELSKTVVQNTFT